MRPLGLQATTSKFESAVLEQLDAGYNLARWLMRNEADAQDVVQEACMKALRSADSFHGQEFRPWFLAIVRNTCFTAISRSKDSQCMDAGPEIAADVEAYDPQLLAIRSADADWVRRSINQLPVVLREAIVMREMEGLSYKEIGKIAGVPIGTVMSRLARGRSQLKTLLMESDQSGGHR